MSVEVSSAARLPAGVWCEIAEFLPMENVRTLMYTRKAISYPVARKIENELDRVISRLKEFPSKLDPSFLESHSFSRSIFLRKNRVFHLLLKSSNAEELLNGMSVPSCLGNLSVMLPIHRAMHNALALQNREERRFNIRCTAYDFLGRGAIDEALVGARTVLDETSRGFVQRDIITDLIGVNEIYFAIAVANTILNEIPGNIPPGEGAITGVMHCDAAREEIVSALAEQGDIEKAKEIAATISNPERRDVMYGVIVGALAKQGKITEAIDAANAILDPAYRKRTLEYMA